MWRDSARSSTSSPRRLGPRRDSDRRRHARVRVGRGHQPVRAAALERRRAAGLRRADRRRARKLPRFPKPTIARIRGYCLGGGLAIAMQADLRIAAADSQFGIPAAKLGIAYGFEDCGGWFAGRPGPRAHDPVHRRRIGADEACASAWSIAWSPRGPGATSVRDRATDRRQRAAVGGRVARWRSTRCCSIPRSATGDGPACRGVLRQRRLPRGPSRLSREAPAAVQRPLAAGTVGSPMAFSGC